MYLNLLYSQHNWKWEHDLNDFETLINIKQIWGTCTRLMMFQVQDQTISSCVWWFESCFFFFFLVKVPLSSQWADQSVLQNKFHTVRLSLSSGSNNNKQNTKTGMMTVNTEVFNIYCVYNLFNYVTVISISIHQNICNEMCTQWFFETLIKVEWTLVLALSSFWFINGYWQDIHGKSTA